MRLGGERRPRSPPALVAIALLFGVRIASADPPAAGDAANQAPSGGDAVPPAIVPPLLQFAPAIPYPAGATGDAVVVLALTVNPAGAVRAVKVIEGDEPFVAAAVRAAPEFRFSPATRAGQAVAATIRFEVTFRAPVAEPEAAPVPAAATAAPPQEKPGPAGAPAPAAAPVEVVVHGKRTSPMAVSMTRAEVRQLPGAFGDPFRAMEAMPGVTPIASGLPYFYVRGAPPGNVGYFLDGVRVPYLYHVGLGPSVVHPAMVESVELYPGGYPARFGRFAESFPARPPLRATTCTAKVSSDCSTWVRWRRRASRAAAERSCSAAAIRTRQPFFPSSRRTSRSTTGTTSCAPPTI
jgi:TonB family protein